MKWIFVNNTSLFDLKRAFDEKKVIVYPQEKNVSIGDIIYFYISSPYFAIYYKCEVQETDIPQVENDVQKYILHTQFYKNNQKFVKIKLLKKYKNGIKINFDGKTNLQTSYQITEALYDYIEKKSKTKKKFILKKMNIVAVLGIAIVELVVAFCLSEKKKTPMEERQFENVQYENQVIEDTVEMINLVGKTWDEAKVELNKIGLGIESAGSEESDKYETGQIIKQSVEAGEIIEEHTTIEVITAIKQEKLFEVPDVKGMDEAEAIHRILESDLNVNILKEYDANVKHGKVISQSIEGGEGVSEGTIITLTICDSIKTVVDVIGLTKEQAIEALDNAGFNVEVIEDYSDTIEAGYVMKQSVDSDTKMNVGEKVVITVSKGTDDEKLESVVGLHYSEARERLESKGFNVIVYEEYREGVEPGYVAEQSIPAGSSYATELGHGTEITLYVNSWRQYRWCKKTNFVNWMISLSEGETFEEALEEALEEWNYYYENREYFVIRNYSRYGLGGHWGYIIEQPNEWSEWSYSSIIDDTYICEVEEFKNAEGGYSLRLHFFEKKLAMLGQSGLSAGINQSNPGYINSYEIDYLVQVR